MRRRGGAGVTSPTDDIIEANSDVRVHSSFPKLRLKGTLKSARGLSPFVGVSMRSIQIASNARSFHLKEFYLLQSIQPVEECLQQQLFVDGSSSQTPSRNAATMTLNFAHTGGFEDYGTNSIILDSFVVNPKAFIDVRPV